MGFDFTAARGWRCEPCFHQGKMFPARADGTPLSEADRCAGCGEIVCDRHERKPQPFPATTSTPPERHDNGWDWHNMVQRVTVTEASP